jgi:parallel beta-helix repeat protein
VLSDIEVSACGYGIHVESGGNPTVTLCNVVASAGIGIAIGLFAKGAFTSNAVTLTRGLAGIVVDEGSDPVLDSNVVSSGDHGGIRVHNHGLGRFYSNTVTDHGQGAAVEIDGASSVLFFQNVFTKNKIGIVIHNLGGGVFEQDTISMNHEQGVLILDESEPTLLECNIHGNAGVGIQVSGNASIEGNKVYDGLAGGVLCMPGAGGTLSQNRISRNVGPGVEARGAGSAVFSENAIQDGQSTGVLCSHSCSGFVFNHNNIVNNHTGVQVSDFSNPLLVENHVSFCHSPLWMFFSIIALLSNVVRLVLPRIIVL